MVSCADEVPPNPKQVQDDPVNGEESLRLTGRLESAHLSFSLPRRLVGDLGSVVGCALSRHMDSSGEKPDGATVVPPRSTWSGSGGNKWAEAL